MFGGVYLRPGEGRARCTLDPRAARGAGAAGQGRQGAPHRPVERNAVGRRRVRARRRAARPAAHRHGAEPVLPGQPRGRQRARRSDAPHGVSLLAYSPLGFGAADRQVRRGRLRRRRRSPGRLAIFETMRKQRWGRPEALAAARRYNALARDHGLTPTRMALAFCYTQLARRQHDHRRDHAWRSSTRTSTPGARRCRPSCWRAIDAHPLGDARPGAVTQSDMGKNAHVSETPATQFLRATAWRSPSIVYDYVEHGGTAESARQLGVPEHEVVKTLVMQDEARAAADRADARRPQVSTKNLARADRRQVGRAVQARGGAAPQRLPGRRHLAVRHAQGDAGVRRGDACSRCRASASTAGGAATWSASRRRAGRPARRQAGELRAASAARARCTSPLAPIAEFAYPVPRRDLAAYLIGSLSFAVIVSRVMGLSDPRSYGSGNPGATNVLRSGNKAAARAHAAARCAEGLRAGAAGRAVRRSASGWARARWRWSAWPRSSATCGRCSSASRAARAWPPRPACCSASTRWLGLATLATWLIIAFFFRYSSLASIVAAVFAPFYQLLIWGGGPLAIAITLMGLLLSGATAPTSRAAGRQGKPARRETRRSREAAAPACAFDVASLFAPREGP